MAALKVHIPVKFVGDVALTNLTFSSSGLINLFQ